MLLKLSHGMKNSEVKRFGQDGPDSIEFQITLSLPCKFHNAF